MTYTNTPKKRVWATADWHGYLIDPPKDVNTILFAGDLLPVNIQTKMDLCAEWLSTKFKNYF